MKADVLKKSFKKKAHYAIDCLFSDLFEEISYDEDLFAALLEKAGQADIFPEKNHLVVFLENSDKWKSRVSWEQFERSILAQSYWEDVEETLESLEKVVSNIKAALEQEKLNQESERGE